ncbi:MAG: hypothetical protein FWH31_10215 [Streptococcaceae bacterium]|nr:hypothetical protein [Streptococcaceae bacterium]
MSVIEYKFEIVKKASIIVGFFTFSTDVRVGKFTEMWEFHAYLGLFAGESKINHYV